MQRRRFLNTLPVVIASVACGQKNSGKPRSVGITGIGDASYFTEQRMLESLGVTKLEAPRDVEVVAFNFPAWHPSPWMEQRMGKGWTEWQTLKSARTLFPGHAMPRMPLWGYYNEADPRFAEKEIDLAARSGIDVFMIDWYWHNGTMFYHEQLEQGFLKAPNNTKLKFAVMWANHDWRNVYPAKNPAEAPILLPQMHSVEDCVRAMDYCIEHYFKQPNYWRIDGALVFGIFDFQAFLRLLGESDTQHALAAMRDRVRKAGLGELHIQWNNGFPGRVGKRLREFGLQSATQYHTFSWTYGGKPPGGQTPFGDAAVVTIDKWKEGKSGMPVPFFPDCPVGWDDSPRFSNAAHVVTTRTPDQYGRLCRAARHFVAAQPKKIVYLSAWNEWTEDHVLLPDTQHGYGYLEAVQAAFRG